MNQREMDAWDRLDEFFEKHRERYNLSFGMEYSTIIDYVVSIDITPRRNHPKAREYPAFKTSGMTRAEAIENAIKLTELDLGE